jgi:phosphate transport system substrate-binding protein
MSRLSIMGFAIAAVAVLLVIGFGCSGGKSDGETVVKGSVEVPSGLSGKILIDGSSTVYLISQAAAEEFMRISKDVNVAVAESGTGGGFKKFSNGEIDIAGASRPIEKEEIDACAANGVEFIELPVAFDGLSVVVNPSNDWCDTLTVAELKKIWEPNSTVKNWSDIRAGFPNKPIKLFGAGSDSGTFDYFTEAIVGKKKASRPDYTQSEDDNVLVQGVAGEPNGLGYFGLAYYLENQSKLKLVKIDNGSGGVAPSIETVNNGTYAPLSRPLFIYVNKKALDRPEVAAFVDFYLSGAGQELVESVGYVKMPDKAYELTQARSKAKTTGSLFSGVDTVGKKVEDVLAGDSN